MDLEAPYHLHDPPLSAGVHRLGLHRRRRPQPPRLKRGRRERRDGLRGLEGGGPRRLRRTQAPELHIPGPDEGAVAAAGAVRRGGRGGARRAAGPRLGCGPLRAQLLRRPCGAGGHHRQRRQPSAGRRGGRELRRERQARHVPPDHRAPAANDPVDRRLAGPGGIQQPVPGQRAHDSTSSPVYDGSASLGSRPVVPGLLFTRPHTECRVHVWIHNDHVSSSAGENG